MAAGGRRRSGRILILLAILLIVIIAVAGYFLRSQLFPTVGTVSQDLPTPTPRTDLVKIVVLAQPVPRGSALTEDVLATINYPRAELVEGLFYLNVEDVVGKHVKFDLAQGVPLTPNLLSENPVGSYAAIQIPRGQVAIAIPVNRLTSVAYGLQPGDHINIIGSMLLVDIDPNFQSRLPNFTAQVTVPGPATAEGGPTTASLTINSGGAVSTQGRAELDPTLNQAVYVLPSEEQRPRLVSQTLVQDAMVLWSGEFPANGKIDTSVPTPTPPPAEDGTQPAAPVEAPRPDVITVVVSPQDAVTLNYLLLAGANLNMVMRSAGDIDRINTEAVTLQFILDQYNIPYPAKLPYGLDPRLDLLPATISNTASSQTVAP